MNVKEIVSLYLVSHEYDGLYHPDPFECSCFLADLFPCAFITDECIPGKKIMHDDGDWMIVAKEALCPRR